MNGLLMEFYERIWAVQTELTSAFYATEVLPLHSSTPTPDQDTTSLCGYLVKQKNAFWITPLKNINSGLTGGVLLTAETFTPTILALEAT